MSDLFDTYCGKPDYRRFSKNKKFHLYLLPLLDYCTTTNAIIYLIDSTFEEGNFLVTKLKPRRSSAMRSSKTNTLCNCFYHRTSAHHCNLTVFLEFECILIEGVYQHKLVDLKATAGRYSIQTKDLHHFAHATMREEHVYDEFARHKPYNRWCNV